jgi:hypothetical protein
MRIPRIPVSSVSLYSHIVYIITPLYSNFSSNMFSSFTYLTVALAFASSILGAVIPITTALTSSTTSATATSTSHHITGPVGALFKNSVHDRVYLSEAPEATPSAGGNPSHTSIHKLLLTHTISQQMSSPLFDGLGSFGEDWNMKR